MSDDLKPRDHVVARGGRWYFRRRIPQDRLPQYRPKLEFLESLGTADLAEANRRATRTLELDQEFARKRAVQGGSFVAELEDEEVERIAKLFARTLSPWMTSSA